jgi:VCBS repeat protein
VVGATSPPVAADLDPAYAGLEVVVGTLNSIDNLYVFHADGTLASGWPVDAGTFVTGSPAVGDLDDDGDLEVVAGDFGSNQVVAFHHDGTPVAGWPRPVLANVRASPVLADLDPAFPGLEVVVGVQDGTVWAWHHDGSLVSGWPVLAGNFVERCSPAIGDVDGDGDLEVFIGSYYNGNPVLSTGGMYAFNADGSPLPGWPQLTPTRVSILALAGARRSRW